MASAKKRSERASGSRPSPNRVQPRSSAGVPGVGEAGEGQRGRVEPEIEHVHDPDVDAGRDLRREAHAVVRGGCVERRDPVVAHRDLGGELGQDDHGVDEVVRPLGQDGPHVGHRAPHPEQGRVHGRRPETRWPQVGDGAREDLPVRAPRSTGGGTGGPSEEREEVPAVGLVTDGPQPVDGRLEDAGVTGLPHRRGGIEGEVLGLRACGRPYRRR